MMGLTLSPLTRSEVFSHPTKARVTMTMTGSTLRTTTHILDISSPSQYFTTSGLIVGAIVRLKITDFRYDLPADIIRNKRDSRYFPGHVPAGVKGITKVRVNKYSTLSTLLI